MNCKALDKHVNYGVLHITLFIQPYLNTNLSVKALFECFTERNISLRNGGEKKSGYRRQFVYRQSLNGHLHSLFVKPGNYLFAHAELFIASVSLAAFVISSVKFLLDRKRDAWKVYR